MAEEKSNQEPAHPTISIQEGMDRLELDMCHPGLHQEWQPGVVVVQEPFEGGHAPLHLLVRRWDEQGRSWTSPSDPVLRSPKLAGVLPASSSMREEEFVDFPQQP